MRKNILLIVTSLWFGQILLAQTKYENAKKIIVEVTIPRDYNKENAEISIVHVDDIYAKANSIARQNEVKKITRNFVRWELHASKELWISGSFLQTNAHFIGHLIEPGDSLSIHYSGKSRIFSGRGSEKFKLIDELDTISDSLKNCDSYRSLSLRKTSLSSLADYFLWNDYLDKKLALVIPLIESYKTKLSPYIFNVIKVHALTKIEEERLWKFNTLRYGDHFGLTNKDICSVYDTTMNNNVSKWLRYEAPLVISPYYAWRMLRMDAYREKGLFYKINQSDTLMLGKDDEDPFVLQYHLAIKKYKGIVREKVLAYTFYNSNGIFDIGFTNKVQNLLNDYYGQPGYPEYKKVVREYEKVRRQTDYHLHVRDFILTGKNSQPFSSTQLRGKIVVLDFWFTGCAGCIQMTSALKKVEDIFKNDSNVVFLSISIDKDEKRWLKSISEKKYTTGGGINVYTSGIGSGHKIISDYGVESYPSFFLLNAKGQVLINNKQKNDPRSDQGKSLIDIIKNQLALMKDGPYIMKENNKRVAYYINDTTFFANQIVADYETIKVSTDQNITFDIRLKKMLLIQPSAHQKAEKLFVLSDIEGNFSALRNLLQRNKVINEKLDWIFGEGHLVFAGDMFDRGEQVTECLWLIYSLEEKARAAGGYVHFILGNHEIMNLQGNHKYVRQKYQSNASLIGKTLAQLYNDNSELGRWLRNKNIVEKIGDLLFMHGGISRELNQTPVTLQDINELARPYYGENRKEYGDARVNAIMSSSAGPFWFRGYYKDKPIESIIDSTLQKFGVNRIITGHTIVADTISVHYNAKVINTDTKHAEGKSEALLIEGDYYYRVNDKGDRKLLFIDERKK